ncbi:MAG: hypothetical protein PVF40_06515 [Ectothiorhodospiraceae bacterium]|jgi:MSHA pilin protein MshA
MVIVILGTLAVAAIPRYVDLQDEARRASADGVFGAAQAAAAINFAANVAGAGAPVPAGISDGQGLADAMDGARRSVGA